MASSGTILDIRKKITHVHDMISTSYHESGHTIYGLLHFMMIESVFVFEGKKSKRIEGVTNFDSPDLSKIKNPKLLSELVYHEICFKYAGLTAEKHYFKVISGSDKFPIFLRDGSSEDTMSAAYYIRKYNMAPPGKKRYDYKKEVINKTLNELKENWDAVTIVAHALFQKKKLNYLDLRKLLINRSKNKKFWKLQFDKIDNIYLNNAHLDEAKYMAILPF